MRVHTPSHVARGCLCILALWFFQGCDDVREVLELDPEEIERQLREEPGRPGKVGQIIALRVRQRALLASEDLAFAPEPACVTFRLDASTPSHYSYRLELDLSAPNSARPPLSWREDVSITRDADGNVRVIQKTSYSQETGHQGAREHTWLSVGEQVYTSSDGVRFTTHREPSRRARDAWVARRANTLQVLLSAVGGWEKVLDEGESGDGEVARWRAGAEVLRCGAPVSKEELKWWSRWRSRGSAREATLEVDVHGKRTLTASWDLGQEARLEARFSDRLEVEVPDALEAPPRSSIIEKTESWAEVERALEALEKADVLSLEVEEVVDGDGESVRDGARDE
jgi:hypothetical protein